MLFPWFDSLRMQADVQARDASQKSECMEDAARIISKAFSNCVTDRLLSPIYIPSIRG